MDSATDGSTEVTIVPLEEHIAAEVRGVDASSPQGEETFAELRRAFYMHRTTLAGDGPTVP